MDAAPPPDDMWHGWEDVQHAADNDEESSRAAFLRVLHFAGDHRYTELRTKNAGGTVSSRFFRTPKEVDAFIATMRGSHDVWFGVATRTNNRSGSKEDCGEISAVWVDLDPDDFDPEDEASRDAAIHALYARLDAFPLPPSLIVRSGGGLHVYWLLRGPLSVAEHLTDIEAILNGLAHHLHGDPKAAEVARVLRLPDTLNHKDTYKTPLPVTLDLFDLSRRYDVADFAPFKVTKDRSRKTGDDPSGRIKDGTRNATLTSRGGLLRRHGFQEPVITAALLELNRTECDPPLPEKEVTTIAHSVSKYAAPTPGEVPTLRAFSLAELQDHTCPPRRALLSRGQTPVFSAGHIGQIYAERGVGKTWVMHSLALAAACAGVEVLGFHSPSPCRVLLIDGEMAGEELQERFINLCRLLKIPKSVLKAAVITIVGAD